MAQQLDGHTFATVRVRWVVTAMRALALLALALWAAPAAAGERPISLITDTRYLAIGDSLSSGYGAIPTTQGFTYQLYRNGAIDTTPHTIFVSAAVPGARSADVLDYQVPQAPLFFKDTGHAYRKVVTLTAGGNDLLALLGSGPPDPQAAAAVLQDLAANLAGILGTLLGQAPDAEIFVGNLYDPRLPVPGADALIAAANDVIAQVVGAFPGAAHLVDVYAAFQGRSGLLLSERRGADPFEVDPTNSGYHAMARAFAAAMKR